MNVRSCPKDLLFPFSPYHGDLPPLISTLIVPKHRASLVIYAVDLTAHVSRAKREILAPNKNPKEFECGTRFRLPAKTVTGSPGKPREEKKEKKKKQESKWGQARERKSMIDSVQDKSFLMMLFVSLSTSRSSNKTKTPNQITIYITLSNQASKTRYFRSNGFRLKIAWWLEGKNVFLLRFHDAIYSPSTLRIFFLHFGFPRKPMCTCPTPSPLLSSPLPHRIPLLLARPFSINCRIPRLYSLPRHHLFVPCSECNVLKEVSGSEHK